MKSFPGSAKYVHEFVITESVIIEVYCITVVVEPLLVGAVLQVRISVIHMHYTQI